MPSASVSTTTAVKAGFLAKLRSAYRMLILSSSMSPPSGGAGWGAA
jgi:hypothetical protein